MLHLTNIPICSSFLRDCQSPQQMDAFLQEFRLHGIEGIWAEDSFQKAILPHHIKGYHLLFFSD